ncbi:hypothetical protein NUW54_g3377 [Trametes sanguinea]|uniref:Uncharacterized protein n=1 Tax=Trametes sanguinea TaxID=158606 RepID=A0ACC1Q4I4_9APHY|nr:hypothetical protein NUW54_g3377 [Trametes sanguinea]
MAIFEHVVEQMTPTDDIGLVELWVEILTEAALAASGRAAECPSDPVCTPKQGDGSNAEQLYLRTAVRHHHPVGANLSQSKLPFKKISPEAYAEQNSAEYERLRLRTHHDRAQQALREQKQADFKRAYEREKKRKQRFRKRWEKTPSGPVIDIEDSEQESEPAAVDVHQDSEGVHVPSTAGPHREELAKRSWSASNTGHRRQVQHARLTQKAKVNGTAPPPPLQSRMNWQLYPYWLKIASAQTRMMSWSPTEIVKYLHKTDPELFSGLRVNTLAKWIVSDDSGKKSWSPEVLKRAEDGRRISVTMRSKTLSEYPLVVSDAVTQLRALRLAGIPVQAPLVTAILRAHILHRAPHLLAPGSKFKLSASWVHRFVRDVLNWSSRKSTRAARKVPRNGEDLCERAFLRMVFAIKFHNIKPSMIINADQAGVLLMPSGKQTYEVKGSKDVNVHAHDEKRQMTIVVASSLDGKLLPFQSVWGGTTNVSLPSTEAPRRAEADELGFVYAHGDTRHWSSKETTKKWILEVLDPFLARQRAAGTLPDDEMALLLIDVWLIHIAKKHPDDFLPCMKLTHQNVIIIFVPGGCTGSFQPADVGLQRVVKHVIKQSAVDFLVGTATRRLQAGHKADELLLPTDMPTLRNACVAWLVDAYHYLNKRPEVIRKAWAKCEAKGWNLSYECLTSAAASDHLRKVMASDVAFAAEFANLDTVSGDLTEESEDGNSHDHDDDVALAADVLMVACIPAACISGTQGGDAVTIGSDDEFISADAELDFEEGVAVSPPTLTISAATAPSPLEVGPSLSTASQPSGPPLAPSLSSSCTQGASSSLAVPEKPGKTTSETTYLANIAVSGGVNHAVHCTDEQLRVTDKRRSMKPMKTPSIPERSERSSSPEKDATPNTPRVDAHGKVKISGPMNGTPIPAGYKFGKDAPPPEQPPMPTSTRDRAEKTKSRTAFKGWGFGRTHDKAAAAVPALAPRPVFGVSLEDSLDVAQIASLPAIVFRCIQYLEVKKAEQEEGIYRLSGSTAVIKSLKDRFNAEGDVDLLASDEYWDPHAIAGLLKTFLRELPASILTRDLHLRFLSVIDFVDPQERVRELSHLISSLPVANYSLLRALTAHLILIVQNANINKMTMRNVGIVFSPTLGIPAGVFSLMLGEFKRVFNVDGTLEESAPPADVEDAQAQTSARRNSQHYSEAAADQMLGLAGRVLPVQQEEGQSDADDGEDVVEESGTEATTENEHGLSSAGVTEMTTGLGADPSPPSSMSPCPA